MKKLIAAVVLLAGLSVQAEARSPRPQFDTPEFAVEICTSAAVAITAASGSGVDAATAGVSLSSATSINIQNLDSSLNVSLGFESNVSTFAAAAQGMEIGPKQDKSIQLNLDKRTGPFLAVPSSIRVVITLCR